MARRALTGALTAMLLPALAVAATGPSLRSVSSKRRHVVAVFTLGDLTPGQILVATRPRKQPNGEFVAANVRLRESMAPTTHNGISRYRTRHRLKPRRYFVEVSGRVTTDCLPGHTCAVRWSNVLRVVIR